MVPEQNRFPAIKNYVQGRIGGSPHLALIVPISPLSSGLSTLCIVFTLFPTRASSDLMGWHLPLSGLLPGVGRTYDEARTLRRLLGIHDTPVVGRAHLPGHVKQGLTTMLYRSVTLLGFAEVNG